ncbi:unnamed protein product [Leptosia nina]|uniref:Peptidase S1 domain-containing protein n=1 Tax=Leptosia nina TaxID=320188 RepID=A0AAV1JID0_9NEOP
MNILKTLFFLCLLMMGVMGIKGGTDVEEPIPYMAAIYVNNAYVCGGVIIDPKWVLSSARCVANYESDPSDVSIRPGIFNLNIRDPEYKADKIIIHKNYAFIYNDISLVRVSKEMQFNKYIGSIKLPDFVTEPGAHLLVTGFGQSDMNSDNINHLQALNMTTISKDECNKNRRRKVTEDQICAFGDKPGTNVCKGDYGSPMVDTAKKVVIAIVSTPTCGRKIPSIFTNLVYYKNWIGGVMEDNQK